jgi:formate dehydrogenase iron-sulfur subunit
VMIYHVTLRQFWSFARTGFKFTMTTLVLGTATTLCTSVLAGYLGRAQSGAPELAAIALTLSKVLMLCVGVELAFELSIFLHLRDKQHSELKRSALLLAGELRKHGELRLIAAGAGGLLLPLAVIGSVGAAVNVSTLVYALLSLALLTAGELIERTLFFTAVSAPRMPGAVR